MNRHKLETFTRLGFASRGVMYLLIALLVLLSGRAEDGTGAMEYLGGGPGQIVLLLMAAGFAAYGLWRLADAWLDSEGNGSEAKGIAMRVGAAGSGLVHLTLAYYAVRLASGNGGQSGGDSSREGAATALSLPGGQALLALAAAALFVVGGYQLAKAVRATFLRQLERKAAGNAVIRILGRAGYAARGLLFLIMGYLLGRAALDDNAGEAGDMGEALSSLPSSVEMIVAAGLLLFGLFSFVEARYRRINAPRGSLF